MNVALRRGILFSVLLAVCFLSISCDSGGSGDGQPIWIGDWEITSTEGGDFEVGNVWSLTRNEIEIRDFDSSDCSLKEEDVSNINGDTVKFSFEEGVFILEFEGSGGEITATVVESPDSDEVGGEATLQSVSSVPDCE